MGNQNESQLVSLAGSGTEDLSVEECSSWLGRGGGCPNDDIELAY